MIDDETTGGPAVTAKESRGYQRNTSIQESRLANYVSTSSGGHEEVRSSSASQQSRRAGRNGTRRADHGNLRYAIRQCVTEMVADAARMIEAAEADEPIAKATAGLAIHNRLGDVFRMREAREREWAKAVNFLQAALASEEFEAYSVKKCRALKEVIETYLIRHGALDSEDLVAFRSFLRQHGFDPWKALSESNGITEHAE